MPYSEDEPRRHANGDPWHWTDALIMWTLDGLIWLGMIAPGLLLGFGLGWWGHGCRMA